MKSKDAWVVALAVLLGAPGTARAEEAGAAPAGEEAAAAGEGETEVSRELGEARRRIEELTARLERLEAASAARAATDEEDELEALRREAEALAAEPESAEEHAESELPADQIFTSGQRSLQALNPEISVVIDTGLMVAMQDGEPPSLVGIVDHEHVESSGHTHGGHSHATASETGFFFRHLGIHFETNLDPFSFTKIAVGVDPSGLHLEEAYVTWVGIAPGLSLTVGQFLQQFGVVSRWHLPSLDQFDQPLAITELLGGGIGQPGLSFDWLIPTPWSTTSHLLTLQLTQPTNEHLFSGEYVEVPTALLRLQNYFDLTDSLYLQLGLTGMWGMHTRDAEDVVGDPVPAYDRDGEPILLYDESGAEIGPLMVDPAPVHLDAFRGNTWLGGADLTLSWSPLRRERYQHVTWRTELFFVSQEHRGGTLQALGGYSYLDVGLSEAWVVGARGDLTQPFELDNGDELRWQVAGYLTWWQSEWVLLRLQYSHADGAGRPMEDRLVLQFVFAAGPHKHERY